MVFPELKYQRYSAPNSDVSQISRFPAQFSTHTWNMKNNYANQRCFRIDRTWFFPDQRCSELKIPNFISQKISAVTVLIFLLWNIYFSALITAESTLFGDFQVIYSAESELKQRRSVLIISESERISAEIFWDFSPGFFILDSMNTENIYSSLYTVCFRSFGWDPFHCLVPNAQQWLRPDHVSVHRVHSGLGGRQTHDHSRLIHHKSYWMEWKYR